MNYSEKEIADFITGPAYNAWWLMGNIEGWGGPYASVTDRQPEETGAENAEAYEVIGD